MQLFENMDAVWIFGEVSAPRAKRFDHLKPSSLVYRSEIACTATDWMEFCLGVVITDSNQSLTGNRCAPRCLVHQAFLIARCSLC